MLNLSPPSSSSSSSCQKPRRHKFRLLRPSVYNTAERARVRGGAGVGTRQWKSDFSASCRVSAFLVRRCNEESSRRSQRCRFLQPFSKPRRAVQRESSSWPTGWWTTGVANSQISDALSPALLELHQAPARRSRPLLRSPVTLDANSSENRVRKRTWLRFLPKLVLVNDHLSWQQEDHPFFFRVKLEVEC